MEEYNKITNQLIFIYGIKILDFFFNFILFLVLARSLSQHEFGIYSIISISILIITNIFDLGLSTFILKDLSGKDKGIQKANFGKIFSFALIEIGIIGFILLTIGYFIIKYLGYSDISHLFFFAIIIAGIIILGNFMVNYVLLSKQSPKAKIIEFLIQSAWILPLIIITLFYRLNIDYIFETKLILSLTVLLCIVYYFKRKGVMFLTRLDNGYIKKAMIFGLPLSLLSLSQLLISGADRYIIGLFQSADAVGSYSYIYSLLNIILVFFIASIDTVLYPYIITAFNKNDLNKSNFLLNASLKYSLLLTLPGVVGFFILSSEIISLISGTKYIGTVSIIPFLILFPVLQCLIVVIQKTLLMRGKTLELSYIFVMGAIVNIVLNFILVPRYSYYGAGIALTLTYIILAIALIVRSKNFIKYDYKYLRLERILLSTIMMAFLISFIHPQSLIGKIMTVILGLLVYIVGLYVTKAYVSEEMTLIKSFFTFKR